MATLVGKVGIVMKGDWSSSPTYEALDAVSYNGGLYIAKQAVPANTAPTNTTYWQIATDMSTFLDGIDFAKNTAKSANIQLKYTGSASKFKLTGARSTQGMVLFYAGYPYAGATTLNRRGLYLVDYNGSIMEVTNQGYTLPTVEMGQNDIIVTLPYNYAYVFLITSDKFEFSTVS